MDSGNRIDVIGSRSAREVSHGRSEINHRLLRDVQVRMYRTGRLGRDEVCDAPSELIRVAENLGDRVENACPICDELGMVLVTFAFGKGLPKSGRAIRDREEIRKLRSARPYIELYVVEVCLQCGWNFLLQRVAESDVAS